MKGVREILNRPKSHKAVLKSASDLLDISLGHPGILQTLLELTTIAGSRQQHGQVKLYDTLPCKHG